MQVFKVKEAIVHFYGIQKQQQHYSFYPTKVSWSIEKVSHCISVEMQYVPGTLCVYICCFAKII